MMVLCAGFVSAQTINTVRGFVPGGSTNSAFGTYAAFGQPFATIANNHGHEVSVGLAQMQLVTDSITDVVTCGQGYHKHGFDLTEEELQELLVQCENEGQRGYLRSQKPNVAVQDYYYDSLVVIDLYVCPCTTTVENEEYEVIALNGECWFKENMRNNFEGSMLYTSELNSVDPADPEQLKTFGRLYTYEATISGAEVCEDGEIQGICPEKWHLPTVDEVDPLFTLPAENLRVDGHWIVDGNNNMTEFSAQPAGYYNSISQRFEGMLTETDFWMVDCDNLNPEDNQLPVLQLIYSCNTPLKPNRPKEDAISVRCVYNIVKHLEDCEPDQNPNTNPVPPTPQYTCPSVSFEPSDAVFVIPGTIASYGEIMDYISSVAFDGLVRGNSGDPDSVKNEAITGITADGVFAWQYQGNMPTEEILGLDGDIVITFDNGQVCKTHVSKEVEPTPVDCENAAQIDGVQVMAPNKVSFTLTNYSDVDVLRFDGTVYVTDGGVQEALTMQNPHEGLYIEHTPNSNLWAFEYNPSSATATVDSMKGYVRVNPNTECKDSVYFNTKPIIEPTTCPSLGNVQLDADLGFTADIVNATENTTVKVIYVAGYTTAELGQAGSYIDNNNGVAQDVTISNNSIEWNYDPTNNNILYLTDLTAGVIIYNGGEEACDTVPVTIYPLPCPVFENISVSNIDNVYGVSATFSHVEGAEVRINYVAFYDAANEPDTKECDFSAEATPIISVSNTKDSVYCSYEKGNDYVLLTPNKIKAVVSLWNQGADYPCAVSDSVVVYEATPSQVEPTPVGDICPSLIDYEATQTTYVTFHLDNYPSIAALSITFDVYGSDSQTPILTNQQATLDPTQIDQYGNINWQYTPAPGITTVSNIIGTLTITPDGFASCYDKNEDFQTIQQ